MQVVSSVNSPQLITTQKERTNYEDKLPQVSMCTTKHKYILYIIYLNETHNTEAVLMISLFVYLTGAWKYVIIKE